MKKTLVISAINFTEGGPLTVLRDAVSSAVSKLGADWNIVVLAHSRALLPDSPVRIIEFPRSKGAWGRRLYYEWFKFKALSRDLNADLWLSLHDITPRVDARRQAVYCHNPAPFFRPTFAESRLEPTLLLFSLFYRFLYGAFIRRNRFVIVQQDWLRCEFRRMFGALDVVVAHPQPNLTVRPVVACDGKPFVFLYPALPRVFKNFETLAEATQILQGRGCRDFEVRFTLSGTENAYSKALHDRYGHIPALRWIGRQTGAQMLEQYGRCGAVVFPSRLETWGLPISEAKAYGRPLLVADLPYAHESVGSCDSVSFFDPKDPQQLADLMQSMLEGRWKASVVQAAPLAAPSAADWPGLWALLVEGL